MVVITNSVKRNHDEAVNSSMPPLDGVDAAIVMQETRERFISRFEHDCGTMGGLAAPDAGAGAAAEIVTLCHRTAGLAGTIGFPSVGRAAATLEDGLREGTIPLADVPAHLTGMREALAKESTVSAAPGPPAQSAPVTALNVLVVDDDQLQRIITTAALRRAGHQPLAAASGEEALASIAAEHPDVILLDVEMPGLGGYALCRRIKSEPDLASIPVAFLSAHTDVDDRLAGLSHGADDFLTKPIDPRELALRVQLLGRRGSVEARLPTDVISADAFHEAAERELARDRAALALIRSPAERIGEVAMIARDEIRRRDLCGLHDRTHVALLMPDMSATTARQRTGAIVEKCRTAGFGSVYAGIAASPNAGGRRVADLIDEADEALVIARYQNLPAATRSDSAPAVPKQTVAPMVLVADDDPDVVRILDAHLGSGGYRRILTFDGIQAVEEIRAQHPDVLVLDLMMPRMTGFDVLARLHDLEGYRPRVIVLSARGREDDVVRAFSLGVDDFITKPFNPQELLARIARLTR